MRRVPPWLVSVAVHAVIAGALWVVLRGGEAGRAPARSASVQLVEVEVAPREQPARVAAVRGGGGAAAEATSQAQAKAKARKARVRIEAPASMPARTETVAEAETVAETEAEAEAETEAEAEAGNGNGNGEGNGNGNGNGEGNGNGNGIGDGDGNGESPMRAFDRMVAGPRSKARPPKLVYPRRERDEDPERLYIAVLKIDEDGAVVGAKLKKAPPGRSADRAISAVFRFAYDPALDDDGRPVAAVVEQRFMVE